MSWMEALGDTIDARVGEILKKSGTLAHDPRSTITPARSRPDEAGWRAIELLRQLAPTAAGIRIGATLGEGGMGVVRAGDQVALGREVAIKSLKAAERTDVATLKLLREAWVTGALEHPNIVPIYDILLDAEGSPQIVLKKIGGASWSERMGEPPADRRQMRDPARLEHDLRVFEQVCNAVHFAHSRGILHRDIKPENVMIGEFGEVYLLDWGIAVALADDGTGRLPLAADATEMAGTPAYMAPEMLGFGPGLISVRTDVHLLGGTLFQLIAGRAPHEGKSFADIVLGIVRSEPALPEATPAELGRIVRRAMAAEPGDRFASAEELRIAVSGFLEHRGSLKLSEDASTRLDELLAERQRGDGDHDARWLRLYHLFGECRFGFREALRIWAENEDAREGLGRAVRAMAELELDEGDPRAAGLLLAELDDPPVDLAARVTEARAARAVEERRLSELARDHDGSLGRRTRAFYGGVLGVVWTVAPWARSAWERPDSGQNLLWSVAGAVATLALAGGLGFWGRESLSKSVINRRLVWGVLVTLLAQLSLFSAGWWLGMDYGHVRVLLMLLYAVTATLAASTIDRRLWPTAVGFVALFALVVAVPAYTNPMQSLANLILTLNIVLIWGRATGGEPDAGEPGDEGRPRLSARRP